MDNVQFIRDCLIFNEKVPVRIFIVDADGREYEVSMIDEEYVHTLDGETFEDGQIKFVFAYLIPKDEE